MHVKVVILSVPLLLITLMAKPITGLWNFLNNDTVWKPMDNEKPQETQHFLDNLSHSSLGFTFMHLHFIYLNVLWELNLQPWHKMSYFTLTHKSTKSSLFKPYLYIYSFILKQQGIKVRWIEIKHSECFQKNLKWINVSQSSPQMPVN